MKLTTIDRRRKDMIFGINAANTFIGGVASTVPDATTLASRLQITTSDISHFAIVGDDIEAAILKKYSITQFTGTIAQDNPTYFFDRDGMMEKAFVAFSQLTRCKFIYLKNLKQLGETYGDNYVFNNINAGCKIYVPPFFQTNNLGNPDGDLTYAIGRGCSVRYLDSFIKPDAVSDLSAGTVTNSSIQLNFTTPASTSPVDYYEVYINGVYHSQINASGDYVLGLSGGTTYNNITLITVDTKYNKSGYSNAVSAETSSTSLVPTTNLVSYYKLDESTGDAIDSVNAHNGTVTNVTRPVATANGGSGYSFNGTSSVVEIADNDDHSFVNVNGDLPFSIAFWINIKSTATQIIFNRRGTGHEWQVSYVSGKIGLEMYSQNNAANRINVSAPITTNAQHLVVITYDGSASNAGVNITIDNTSPTITRTLAGTYIGMANSTNKTTLGRYGGGGYSFNGIFDELGIWKNKVLTAQEKTDLWNDGNGTTL